MSPLSNKSYYNNSVTTSLPLPQHTFPTQCNLFERIIRQIPIQGKSSGYPLFDILYCSPTSSLVGSIPFLSSLPSSMHLCFNLFPKRKRPYFISMKVKLCLESRCDHILLLSERFSRPIFLTILSSNYYGVFS
jgi:hypothetical protein